MGTILVRNAIKRKSGFLYYKFLTCGFELIQWTERAMFVRLKWLVAEKRKRNKFLLKRGENNSLIYFNIFIN